MNPDKQRIAIAEACGWRAARPIYPGAAGLWHIIGPNGLASHVYDTEAFAWAAADIPDYLSDLNAMHEAEKVLTDEQSYGYGCWLGKNTVGRTTGEWQKAIFGATAAQRAEAFLRTLGKWEDDQ